MDSADSSWNEERVDYTIQLEEWSIQQIHAPQKKRKFDGQADDSVFKNAISTADPRTTSLITPTYNESSSVTSPWHMRRLSPHGLETKFNCHGAQRVFKRYTSLTYVGALSLRSKTEFDNPHVQQVFKCSSLLE